MLRAPKHDLSGVLEIDRYAFARDRLDLAEAPVRAFFMTDKRADFEEKC